MIDVDNPALLSLRTFFRQTYQVNGPRPQLDQGYAFSQVGGGRRKNIPPMKGPAQLGQLIPGVGQSHGFQDIGRFQNQAENAIIRPDKGTVAGADGHRPALAAHSRVNNNTVNGSLGVITKGLVKGKGGRLNILRGNIV